MQKRSTWFLLGILALVSARAAAADNGTSAEEKPEKTGKPVIYQVFPRLFGNSSTTNQAWGSIETNGVGKFDDFTDAALEGIAELGVTHIWYTGVLHHALIGDYSEYGISADDPDVVKGRAGSPYAIKDYYNVNPDLALDPGQRLQEFQALIERTHRHGMKVLIDIVPNHVARAYESVSKPEGVTDFGANDDPTVEYKRNNNFYYVVGEDFRVPEAAPGYQVLGGEAHPLADGQFKESPAKWTGNGVRSSQPRHDDWYETVKINYGVRPDGSHDFEQLPADYKDKGYEQHYRFWQDKSVPDSWRKFRDIALYWTVMGIDGFRYDMAEMVPVEFWSYLNASIKMANPEAFLLAEVYTPSLYRDYIQLGKMDYLYDKVGFYDTLKLIMQGKGSTDDLPPIQSSLADIESHMLHFLENHDEQRIASPGFVGNAESGKPAMLVAVTISRSPSLLYFAQELGESGDGDAGFGDPSRTTIFDYWAVPTLQRWVNGGRFDGGQLSSAERQLRDFYRRLLRFSASNPAMRGQYAEIHTANRSISKGYTNRLFGFVRWLGPERLIVVANFNGEETAATSVVLPAGIVSEWQLHDGRYALSEQLYGHNNSELRVKDRSANFKLRLPPLESVILKVAAAPNN